MRFNDIPEERTCYCSWGRTALYLAFMSIGIRDKEVLLPAFTCATNLPPAIYAAGGTPIFVDVNLQDLGMDLDDLQSKISHRTAVIISHSYYGFVPSNVMDVQQLASNRNIPHVFDNSHAWGMNVYGDITTYSFSKSFTGPAGGAVLFASTALYERAKKFQEEQSSLFHSIVTDSIAFGYMKSLMKDRLKERPYRLEYYFLKRCVSKLVRMVGMYSFPNFYREIIPYGLFDTRITPWQKECIAHELSIQESLFEARRKLAEALSQYLPPLVMGGNFPVYASFVDNIARVEAVMRELSVRTRRAWPYTQKYVKEQRTPNVCKLRDHLLLLDTDDLTFDKIRRFGQYAM